MLAQIPKNCCGLAAQSGRVAGVKGFLETVCAAIMLTGCAVHRSVVCAWIFSLEIDCG